MSIVVAYSPDQYGQAALDAGEAEALRDKETMVVVNVTRGDALVDRRYAHDDDFAGLAGRLAADGVQVEVVREMVRDVAEAVVDTARERRARLVVVGVRHRTPVGKLLLGSVAQRVILDAPCPVLAVKPPQE